METALTRVHSEMPAEASSMAKKGRKVRPMNMLERMVYGPMGVAANTTPFGNIAYHKGNMDAAMLAPEDVMAHELTHVGQIDRDGGPILSAFKTIRGNAGNSYLDRDFEAEAMRRELSKMGQRTRKTDIVLPGS